MHSRIDKTTKRSTLIKICLHIFSVSRPTGVIASVRSMFCIPRREPRQKRLKQVRQRKCRLHGYGAGEEAAPVTDGELQGAHS